MLREDHVLFTYLHLAPDAPQTEDLVNSGACCIAYETVTDRKGGLPLLAPMSEVAGRLSIQAGAWCLEKAHGGRGVLLGGVPGVEPAKVVIIGGGTVGFNAAQMAVGLGARVVVMDRDADVMKFLDANFESRIETVFSNADSIERHIRDADLVVGGVLIPGAAAPKLISREQLSHMRPGAVLVDVAIDQGGCFETSKPTTHAEPTYVVDDIVHYCVANMPGAVPRTSTFALNNVTLPFTLQLADKGAKRAMIDNHHLLEGLNVHRGKVTYEDVARDLGYEYTPAREALTL
jgi:alanine dehydrogenase